MKVKSVISAILASLLLVASLAVFALEKAPVLSLQAARKLVAGCEAKAVEKGWKMNIAIVDVGANLIEFSRSWVRRILPCVRHRLPLTSLSHHASLKA